MEIVRIFRSIQTVNWNHVSACGDSAAILAAKGDFIEILRILKDIPDIDWNLTNRKGDTVLTAALLNSNIESAKIILSIPSLVIDAKALKKQNIPREMVERCVESLTDTNNEINSNIKRLVETGSKVYSHMNSLLASLGDD